MALIHVYNTISNEHSEVNANGKLNTILSNLNIKNSIAIKEGNRIDGNYDVTENDVIYIRVVPGTTAVIAVVSLVCAVVAVGVGVGSAIYAKKQSDEAKKQMEKAQRDANNLAQQINTLPFIRGGKNQNALGYPVQFVMGDVYNTGYQLTDGFYSIGGDKGQDLFYHCILSLGHGTQKVKQVLIGESSLVKNDNGITGVNSFDSTSMFYDSRNKLEIADSGHDFTTTQYKQKVVCSLDNSEIKHDYGKDAVPIIKQLSNNVMKAEVCIQFNGLRWYNNGNWEKCGVNINAEWTNDDGAHWHSMTWNNSPQSELVKMSSAEVWIAKLSGQIDSSGNPTVSSIVKVGSDYYRRQSNTFQFYENTNQTVRFVATKTFSAAESYNKEISIRLTRTNAKHESNSNEDAYIVYYQTCCFDYAKSTSSNLMACKPVEDKINNIVKLGVTIAATNSTQEQLEEFHAYTIGCARTFSGNTLSSNKVPTRNPAAWLIEILTSDTHVHSKYELSELNLNSFAALYSYCETMHFYTDGIVTQNIKKQDLLEEILKTVNANLIINAEGELEVVIDKEETTPVALINSENIISSNYAKSMEIVPDGAKVTFINRDNWKVDTVNVMIDGQPAEDTDKLMEYNINYVTTYEHAYKLMQRKLREQQLQPYTIKVNIGREGDYYPLFSTVLLQLQQFKQGITSSVVAGVTVSNGYITKITLSDYVDFDTTSRYGLIIQAQTDGGRKQIYSEVTGSGRTRELTLATSIKNEGIVPVVSNICSFGYLNNDGSFTKITKTMKICEINPNDTTGYELTLKEYNPAVYQFGTIPAYKSNLSSKPKSRINTNATLEDVQRAENAALEAIQSRNITMRNLINLQSEGTENEVATYGGNLYIYLQGEWQPISTAQYLGEYSYMPVAVSTGAYFYATEDFIGKTLVNINGDKLLINNKLLRIGVKYFNAGFIYVFNGSTWVKVDDKSNFRYMSLFTQNVKHVSENLGLMLQDPTNAKDGDWYCYGGTTTQTRINGYVYLYKEETKTWSELNPASSENADYYMSSLNNILKTDAVNSTNTGYFNVIFANALITSAATVDKLLTKELTLKSGGSIKSSNFVAGSTGFKIDGDTGAAEFGKGSLFRGGLGKEIKLKLDTKLTQLADTELNLVFGWYFPTGMGLASYKILLGMFITNSYSHFEGTVYYEIDYSYTFIFNNSDYLGIEYETEYGQVINKRYLKIITKSSSVLKAFIDTNSLTIITLKFA